MATMGAPKCLISSDIIKILVTEIAENIEK